MAIAVAAIPTAAIAIAIAVAATAAVAIAAAIAVAVDACYGRGAAPNLVRGIIFTRVALKDLRISAPHPK